MPFTSLKFIFFFPAVCFIFFFLPKKSKTWFLIAASYFFYLNAIPFYALLLLSTTIITYGSGCLIDRNTDEKTRKLYLNTTIVLLVSTLSLFKYYYFINQTFFTMFSWVGMRWNYPEIKILLPLGISYFTFQTLGYLFDVYNHTSKAERNFKYYLLFVSFFPTIVSGPIERARNMIPQYRKWSTFDYNNMVKGLKWMLWGYFMKLVVADGLGVYIDEIYGSANIQSSNTLLFVSALYPFQLYCDFGGYSFIAVGVAKVLGFNVMQNFKRPYLFSTSITNFWRRNHISLTTWVTDYIYTPLSIKFRYWGNSGLVISIIITFLIVGIWHGAAWTFVIYGLIHGTMLSFDAINQKRRSKIERKWNLKEKWWYVVITCFFTYVLVCFSFIFFRSNSISMASTIINNIFWHDGPFNLGGSTARLAFSVFALIMVILSDFRDEYHPSKVLLFENKFLIIRWSAYISIILLILLLGNFESNKFIYFQF